MTRSSRTAEKSTGIVRAIRAVFLVAILLLVALYGFERSHRPLPFGLSCKLPTPRACLADLALRAESVDARNLIPESEALARANPALDLAQSFNGVLLGKDGQVEKSGKFLLNSARLGWRDLAGQTFSYLLAVQDEDPVRAALHLDSIYKLDEGNVANAQLMEPLLADPRLREEFAKHLAVSTHYRSQFIASYVGVPEEAWEARLDLLGKAVQYGLDLPVEDISRIVWRLYREDGRRALDFWLATQGDGDFADSALAWDAKLERTEFSAALSPFLWHARDAGRTGAKVITDGNHKAIVFGRRVNGPPRELAAIAVPLPTGFFPVSWKTTPGAQGIFLGARCAGQGTAEIVQIQQVVGDETGAIIEVGEGCEIPFITVVAGRGEHQANEGVAEVRIAERPILF